MRRIEVSDLESWSQNVENKVRLQNGSTLIHSAQATGAPPLVCCVLEIIVRSRNFIQIQHVWFFFYFFIDVKKKMQTHNNPFNGLHAHFFFYFWSVCGKGIFYPCEVEWSSNRNGHAYSKSGFSNVSVFIQFGRTNRLWLECLAPCKNCVSVPAHLFEPLPQWGQGVTPVTLLPRSNHAGSLSPVVFLTRPLFLSRLQTHCQVCSSPSKTFPGVPATNSSSC